MRTVRIALIVSWVAGVACSPDIQAPDAVSDGGNVTAIRILPESASVVIGSDLPFSADVSTSNGSSRARITWISSDSTVAVISATGVLSAKQRGAVQIVATASGVSAASKVTVIHGTRDSALVDGADTTRLTVGLGSSIAIPPGALPLGTRITLEETRSEDTTTVRPLSPKVHVAVSRAELPSTTSNRARADTSRIALTVVSPTDHRTLEAKGQSIGLEVQIGDSMGDTIPIVYAPSELQVAVDRNNSVTSLATVFLPSETLSDALSVRAVQVDLECRDVTKRFYHPDKERSTNVNRAKITLILIHVHEPAFLTTHVISKRARGRSDTLSLKLLD